MLKANASVTRTSIVHVNQTKRRRKLPASEAVGFYLHDDCGKWQIVHKITTEQIKCNYNFHLN